MPVAFSEANLEEMAKIALILASNVKYHFKFGINAQDLSSEPNFNQIRLKIKNFEILNDTVT